VEIEPSVTLERKRDRERERKRAEERGGDRRIEHRHNNIYCYFQCDVGAWGENQKNGHTKLSVRESVCVCVRVSNKESKILLYKI